MRVAGSPVHLQTLQRQQQNQLEQVQQKQLIKQRQADEVNQAALDKLQQRRERLETRTIEQSFEAMDSSRLRKMDDAQAIADLPHRNQQAIQTFADNGPSAEERLGVELAGIDVFA